MTPSDPAAIPGRSTAVRTRLPVLISPSSTHLRYTLSGTPKRPGFPLLFRLAHVRFSVGQPVGLPPRIAGHPFPGRKARARRQSASALSRGGGPVGPPPLIPTAILPGGRAGVYRLAGVFVHARRQAGRCGSCPRQGSVRRRLCSRRGDSTLIGAWVGRPRIDGFRLVTASEDTTSEAAVICGTAQGWETVAGMGRSSGIRNGLRNGAGTAAIEEMSELRPALSAG